MKTNKHDKLRQLARMAFRYVYAIDTASEHERKRELVRYVQRNVDNGAVPEALTHDDIADFDIVDFMVHRKENVFIAEVNGKSYEGEFTVKCNADDGCEPDTVNVQTWGTVAHIPVTDALLIEALTLKLMEYIQDHESEYAAQDAEAREARKADEQYDAYVDRKLDEQGE